MFNNNKSLIKVESKYGVITIEWKREEVGDE